MSSLLAGLKFKSHRAVDDGGGGEGAALPAAKVSRMEWMMNPIPLSGRARQQQQEEVDPVALARKAEEEAKQAKLEEEIEKVEWCVSN